ncbi:diguanylate cyclase [Aeromonas veronii]|uniref:sensor domain-containing diguanylate cyclase n=1 Tax=Aeromonas veronii TaxID=654 RepID=UPI000F5D611C|nr:diguanylate cyclase [Aeromonas veronii]MCX0424645.1 diguanylate cyclase [Aeromonas veronii]RRA91455.1 diguanylate cyclase [Aeromonas veronii bv. sobria]TNI73636.1 sensory histidine kinase [Aeromonas veronii]WIJ41229.1 diguanylate cyclase [Aeromonas veronii]
MFTQGSHADIKSSLDAIGAAVAVFSLDKDDHFVLVSANDTFAKAFELDVLGSIGKQLSEMFPRYITNTIEPPMHECVRMQTGLESELPIDSLSRTSWWRFILSPIIPEQARINRIIVTAIDITARMQLEEALTTSRRRFEAVVNSAYDGIISVSSESRIELINTAACEMFGIDESYLGKRLETLLPQRFRANHETYFKAFSSSPINSRPMHARASVMGLRRDGSEFPLEVTIAKINLGPTTEMTAILRDISERARLVEELKVAATTDPLTGIANRRRFNELVNAEMQRCQRFGHTMSLLLIDIDHFKEVNDTFGHQQGDLAILSLVKRISKQLREVDMLGRWGGEEFIVLLPETSLELAWASAERIRLAIESQHHALDGALEISLTISIGISASKGSHDTVEKVVRRADTALYLAKKQGRNCCRKEEPEPT